MSAFNSSKGGSIGTALDRVINKNINYTKSTLNLIKKYGDKTIVGLIVKRKPISVSAILTLARKVSKTLERTFSSKVYDELYHLYIEIRLEDGTTLILEKNSVIALSKTTRKAEEEYVVSNVPDITLNQMLDKTQVKMKSKYFVYDAIKNNCQVFLLAIMTSNNISGTETFIKQDVSKLIGKAIQKSIKTLTEIGGIATTLFD